VPRQAVRRFLNVRSSIVVGATRRAHSVNWLIRANRWVVAGLAIGVFLAEHFTPHAPISVLPNVAVVMLSLWSTRSSDIYLAAGSRPCWC